VIHRLFESEGPTAFEVLCPTDSEGYVVEADCPVIITHDKPWFMRTVKCARKEDGIVDASSELAGELPERTGTRWTVE
jgi:hypothetical protein